MDFIISDTHFKEPHILKLSRKNFKNSKEHDDLIINNWNRIVGKDDTIYHLGDIGSLTQGELTNLLKKLNGKKILIKGNHDKMDNEYYLKCGFAEVYDGPYFYNKQIVLSHEPIPIDNKYFINIHGHLHSAVLDLNNYYNASVDVNFYRPQEMEYYVKRASNLKKVDKTFGEEWYYENYKFFSTN